MNCAQVTDIVSSSIVFMCNLLLCEDQNGSSSGACIGPSQIQHVFLLPKGSGLWTLLIGIGIDATSGFLIFLFFYNVWLLDVRRIWWSCVEIIAAWHLSMPIPRGESPPRPRFSCRHSILQNGPSLDRLHIASPLVSNLHIPT